MDNEFSGEDVNQFRSLATSRRHVATLDAATRGQRGASARYREILAPLGLGDELRAALVTPAGCWGYLCLHRADSPHGFTDAEARIIGRLTAHLGSACQQGVSVPPYGGTTGAPGVVILHPDLTIAAITGEAEQWLAHIADHVADRGRLPAAVYAVAAQLLRIEQATAHAGATPTVRVPNITGGWLLVHASRLNPSAGGDIAVIIEPAKPSAMAPIVLSAYGLTPREREVALLVLSGTSTNAIGAQLHLSPYTVKDHLKSIFDKMGLRSRRDLVAQLLGGK